MSKIIAEKRDLGGTFEEKLKQKEEVKATLEIRRIQLKQPKN